MSSVHGRLRSVQCGGPGPFESLRDANVACVGKSWLICVNV